MEILWLAIVLYSIGLGIVLHFKPAVMFNENGTWKEFGYQRSSSEKSRHTIFPFWLFAVSWAFVSYAVAAAITWVLPTDGMLSATTAAAAVNTFNSYSQAEYSDSESEDIPVTQVEEPKRGRGRPRKDKPRPGYYVLDPETKDGLRKYIYYGEKPPEA